MGYVQSVVCNHPGIQRFSTDKDTYSVNTYTCSKRMCQVNGAFSIWCVRVLPAFYRQTLARSTHAYLQQKMYSKSMVRQVNGCHHRGGGSTTDDLRHHPPLTSGGSITSGWRAHGAEHMHDRAPVKPAG
jgi:hypothetical protein